MSRIVLGFVLGFLIPFIARRLGKILPATTGIILYRLLHVPHFAHANDPLRYKLLQQKWKCLFLNAFIFAVLNASLFFLAHLYLPAQIRLYADIFIWIILLAANVDMRFYLLPDCLTIPLLLSGFLFFFQCDEIMEKYYNYLLELFLYTYKFFKDKFYETCFEYLLEEILLRNKIMKNKYEEKNQFIFKFLKVIEQLYSFKSIRANENIIFIIVNYLQNCLKENQNKEEPYLNKILRVLLFNSTKIEIEKRKTIFELIKNFTGDDLMSNLKWIFTLDDIESSDYYNFVFLESIPISIDFLFSFFKQGIPLTMNENNVSKFKNLSYSIENKMEIEEENIKEIYDKNGFIKNIVESCNIITKEKNVEDLLDPIRTMITMDSSYYKLFV